MTAPDAHLSSKPTYTLHPSFPVRRVSWRPGYECEVAIVSNEELSVPGPPLEPQNTSTSGLPGLLSRVGSGLGLDMMKNLNPDPHMINAAVSGAQRAAQGPLPGDTIEIWDVRREWIAKWSVNGSSMEGSISGKQARFPM